MKKRLDIMMVEQGLAPSREKAKAYIMAGEVYVNGQKEDKAGSMFAETAKLCRFIYVKQSDAWTRYPCDEGTAGKNK